MRHVPGTLHDALRLDVPLLDYAINGGGEAGVEAALDLVGLSPLVVFGDEALVPVGEELLGALDIFAALLGDVGDGDGVVQAVGSIDAHGGLFLHVGEVRARRDGRRRIRYVTWEVRDAGVGGVELGRSLQLGACRDGYGRRAAESGPAGSE